MLNRSESMFHRLLYGGAALQQLSMAVLVMLCRSCEVLQHVGAYCCLCGTAAVQRGVVMTLGTLLRAEYCAVLVAVNSIMQIVLYAPLALFYIKVRPWQPCVANLGPTCRPQLHRPAAWMASLVGPEQFKLCVPGASAFGSDQLLGDAIYS